MAEAPFSVFSDDQPVTSNYENSSLYVLEWLLPRIGLPDKIIVKDKATKQPGTIMDTIQEIQGCHDTLIDIESSLNELHQVFLDMTVLVQSQGKQLNDIQSHESRANSYVCRGFGSFSLQGSTRRILEVHLHCHHNIDLLY
ncbi:syntaxin-123 isoform X2 [Arachis hypogaea]|uniref:syntaxin-123 isoform X2 n=1 Tax=Arachis hypogaea TaxID=3818 RepID=UPI003B21E0F8